MDKRFSLYEDVTRYLEIQFALKIYSFIIKSKVCPENTPSEWLKTICYMYDRGWIYHTLENGQITSVVGAYRIEEFKEDTTLKNMPWEESGKILFVPFAASNSEDTLVLKKLLDKYLEKNKDIEEVIFKEDSTDKIKRFKVNGDTNGKTEDTRITENA